MAILLPAVLALVPLLIAPGLLFYFDITPKVGVLLLGTALALPVFARSREGLAPLLGGRSGRWFCALLAAQAFSLAVSTVVSAHPDFSLGGTNWRRFGLVTHAAVLLFALLTAAWVAADPTRLRRLVRAMCAAGVLVSLYAIAQYFGWDPWIPTSAYHIGEGVWTIVRPPATLGYASYAATWLLHVAFLGVGLAMHEQRRTWKLVAVSAAVLAPLAILLSGTRAAILGLAVGGALFVLLRRPRLTARAAAMVAAAAVAMTIFYFSPPGRKLRSRTRWYVEDPRGGSRMLLWRDTLRMASGRWLAGYGPETFSAEFPRFQSAELARAYPDFYQESAHNIFGDALSAQGVPGLAILLGLAGVGTAAGMRARDPLQVALAASLAAAVASQQFTAFIVPTALYFYVTVGALAAGASNPKSRGRPGRLALPAALPGSVLLAIFAVRLLAADYLLARASRHLESAQVADARESYERALAWSPRGVSSDLWYSRSMARQAQAAPDPTGRLQAWQQALIAAERACQTADDRHNAYYSLAALRAGQNDFAETEKNLRAAIRWAPHWFKPHWTLAQVLAAAGRWPEAEREASLAASLNGGKNAEVSRTLDEIRAQVSAAK